MGGRGVKQVPAFFKYTLFAFNLIILIGGIILAIVGVVAVTDERLLNGMEFANDPTMRAGAIFAIVVGIVTVFFSFLGCCGALRESSCLLITYAVLTSLALMGVGAVSIVAFLFESVVGDSMMQALVDGMGEYDEGENGNYNTVAWDTLQQMGQCCGIDGPEDWGQRKPFSDDGAVPKSCCKDVLKCIREQSSDDINRAGCKMVFLKLEEYAGTLAIVALVFSILMFFPSDTAAAHGVGSRFLQDTPSATGFSDNPVQEWRQQRGPRKSASPALKRRERRERREGRNSFANGLLIGERGKVERRPEEGEMDICMGRGSVKVDHCIQGGKGGYKSCSKQKFRVVPTRSQSSPSPSGVARKTKGGENPFLERTSGGYDKVKALLASFLERMGNGEPLTLVNSLEAMTI
ncbi:unnamed protein product [Darwinula stevensoni]|uniref:Tetraspanin n=1 Tax=Darwinula stevensoni TaxID=69355 RepID=A0A7R9A8Z3_9CRUS|nr:unnamed protein product [Darwinula stevensoni]CAG0896941.1 unnamed protein product [Darwinula stevensoni]